MKFEIIFGMFAYDLYIHNILYPKFKSINYYLWQMDSNKVDEVNAPLIQKEEEKLNAK